MSYIKHFKPHNRKGGSKQGYYKVLNHHKYIGDDKTVIYRSSLELRFCQYCDTDINILQWVSEPDLQIKYVNPFKRRIATYYPDFMVKVKSEKNPAGFQWAVIEIKAHSMINLPEGGTAKMTPFMQKSFILNQAKKKAGERVCAEKNMLYLVITEKSPFFAK